jgi:hypothetical protein
MVLATWWGLGNALSIVLAIVLAFAFGYGLSLRPVLAAGVGLRAALGVVLAADTVSIATMEVVDNTLVAAVPGALAAGLSDGLFWGSLAASLVIAFALTVPVNRALIAKGKGHALPIGITTATPTPKMGRPPNVYRWVRGECSGGTS